MPDGADILNGIYPGWCIQHYIVGVLQDQPATLYASTSPNLPPDVAELPWNEINYVLNHKIQGPGKPTLEFIQDVQNAIWILLGEENPAASLETQQMVANANAHPDYVPGEGEITAVIIYSDGMSTTDAHSVQEFIIEVKRNHTPTQTATPTGTATLPTETDTTPTETASPTMTATLPTETDTTPTETASPTMTATLPTETDTTPTETASPTMTATLPTGTDTTPTETASPTMTATLPTGTDTTPTQTATPTETATPPICQPTVVTANFSQIAVGQSVEGMGVVAPGLDIDAKGTAVKILEGSEPVAYGAPNGNAINNGGLTLDRGFSDIENSNGSWGSSIHLHFCSRDFSKQLFAAYAGLWRLEPKFEHIS